MTGETHLECVTGSDVDLALEDGVQFTVVEAHGGKLVAQVQEEVIQLETGAHVETGGNTVHAVAVLEVHGEHIRYFFLIIACKGGNHLVHRIVIDIHAKMGNDNHLEIGILVPVQDFHGSLDAKVLGETSSYALFLFYVRSILDAKAIAHIERLVTGNGMGIGPGQAETIEIGPLLNATTGRNIEDRAIGNTYSSHKTRKIILGTGGRDRGKQNAQDK
jgi:hypothetical protein